jgi:hypothetical protein
MEPIDPTRSVDQPAMAVSGWQIGMLSMCLTQSPKVRWFRFSECENAEIAGSANIADKRSHRYFRAQNGSSLSWEFHEIAAGAALLITLSAMTAFLPFRASRMGIVAGQSNRQFLKWPI